MKILLQIDFPFEGPFGDEMTAAMAGLARSITDEPGFLWKIWTENSSTQEAGGIYLFEDEASARDYLKKHTARLNALGVQKVNGKVFYVNESLSAIDHAPV